MAINVQYQIPSVFWNDRRRRERIALREAQKDRNQRAYEFAQKMNFARENRELDYERGLDTEKRRRQYQLEDRDYKQEVMQEERNYLAEQKKQDQDFKTEFAKADAERRAQMEAQNIQRRLQADMEMADKRLQNEQAMTKMKIESAQQAMQEQNLWKMQESDFLFARNNLLEKQKMLSQNFTFDEFQKQEQKRLEQQAVELQTAYNNGELTGMEFQNAKRDIQLKQCSIMPNIPIQRPTMKDKFANETTEKDGEVFCQLKDGSFKQITNNAENRMKMAKARAERSRMIYEICEAKGWDPADPDDREKINQYLIGIGEEPLIDVNDMSKAVDKWTKDASKPIGFDGRGQ